MVFIIIQGIVKRNPIVFHGNSLPNSALLNFDKSANGDSKGSLLTSDDPKIKCRMLPVYSLYSGQYEEPGTTRYKHVYFNATWQTFRIWIFTVLFVLMAYESVKYLIPLIRRKNIRTSMLILYIVNM